MITSLYRCNSSCRRSRTSLDGIQILGNRPSTSSFRICAASLVRLLLPHVAGTNLRRIAHPQLVTQLAQQIHQPVTVAGGFHADQRRRRYLPVEPFRVARGLHASARQFLLSPYPTNSLAASWDENHIL